MNSKNLSFIIITALLIFSCSKEKKKVEPEIQNSKQEEVIEKTFLNQLIDVRDVNRSFTDGYHVEKFGMQKVNDSIYGFVFKLSDSVLPETVEKYSVGLTGFNSEKKENFKGSFNPIIDKIEGNKYVILKRKMENYQHFDSIDVYIYARKNWKASGRIGSFKVRDILFEE